MIEKLKTEKICQNIVTYNDILLDENWLSRNNFTKIESEHEGGLTSAIKKLIITKNDNTEVILTTDKYCKTFFNKYK